MAAAIPELLGLTLGEGIAFALGTALAPALRPLTQEYENASWHEAVKLIGGDSLRPLGVGDLAGIVAESVEALGWGRDEAAKQGITQKDFDALFHAEQDAPGFATLLQLLRRGLIDTGDFEHGLRKAKLEGRWDTPLEKLRDDRLAPAQVALGIVRSILKDPGFLPVDLDTSGGKVPRYAVSPLDPLDEAEAHGVTRERLRVLVGEIGRPMGAESAASAVFRGIIRRADFNSAIAEGDIRPEWADAIFEHARQIPTARDFFENALRGYHDFDWALEQAKRHGMSEADATVIYQNAGRPMNIRQITQALSRGGKFDPEPGELRDPYMASVVEGSVKPAYYDLALSLKYTLPSPFVMRQLTASGVWTEAKAAQRLKDSGWIPQDADEAAKAWAEPTAAKADTHVGKAQTQLWTATHAAYMAGDASDAVVTEKLPQAGVNAASVPKVLAIWKHEREVIRQRITPAQLKKAVAKAVTNPATGAPWSKDDALAELLSRGWSSQDANTFLDTPTGK